MPANMPRSTGYRLFAKRRVVLLATVAGLGAGMIVGDFGLASESPIAAVVTPAYAQSAKRMAGFADIVEKVKPAVIWVKVRTSATGDNLSMNRDNPPRGSPFEDFFRHFGRPDGDERFGFGFGLPDDGPRSSRRGRPDGDQPSRPQRQQPTMAQGSGFFISADGYAVANEHVVDKAEHVDFTTDDGKTYAARVIGTDERTDLALIKVEGRNDFPYARLGDKRPRVGDWVLAVGNPFGLGGTVTAGNVSARGRDIGAGTNDDFIQIDAAVNRGNSGGPTFDMEGNVIGVNTMIFSPSGGMSASPSTSRPTP